MFVRTPLKTRRKSMKKHRFLSVVFSLVLGLILSLGIVVSAACTKKEEPQDPGTTTEELAAPVITLTNNVLSWAAVDHADGYEIFEGDTSVKTQSQTSYTIEKTEPGSYTYTVKATSTDEHYTTSKASNAQTYVVSAQTGGSEGETPGSGGSGGSEGETPGSGGSGGSGSQTPSTQYENVTTSVDFVAAAKEVSGDPANTANATVSGSYTYNGKITFSEGQRFEPTKSTTGGNGTHYVGCLNTQGKQPMIVKLEGITNSIKLYGAGASGSGVAYLTVSSVAGDGTVTALPDGKSDEVANNTFFTNALELTDLPAGTYSVATSGSVRIYEFSITERLEIGTPAGMVLVPGTTDLLKGRSFTSAGLTANVTYTNSSVKSKSNLTVDSSAVDMTKAGEYPVNVSYTENGVTVNGEYKVKVYEVTAVGVGTTITSGNTQKTFKTVYVKGGTFSTEGLTLTATATCGTSQASFKLLESEYEATATPDLTTTGEKDYTLSVKATARGTAEVQATITINVVDRAVADGNALTLSVNPAAVVSSTSFKTLTDALVYLKQLDLAENVTKIINIADGTYNEKVFIDIPNVQLIGSTTATPDHTTDNGVVIEFDAIAGKLDPSGTAYGTNGSGTVTVANAAKNFVAKNITFKNFYNTYDLYQDSLTVSSDSQAVALLVESPSAAFFNCKLTSYHDTLYSNKGNHYYENCWIEGHTDFIFGQDARAYFYNCHILSIGAGAEEKNGGYVVALKPSSSNYYFVFNTCDFAADANTKVGSVALGRAWGAEMKMVIINSAISNAYSKDAHTAGTSSGQRYCTMSGNEPKAANMIEYGNTGDGSITSSIDNTCTYDASAATDYGKDKLEQILGWDPHGDIL